MRNVWGRQHGEWFAVVSFADLCTGFVEGFVHIQHSSSLSVRPDHAEHWWSRIHVRKSLMSVVTAILVMNISMLLPACDATTSHSRSIEAIPGSAATLQGTAKVPREGASIDFGVYEPNEELEFKRVTEFAKAVGYRPNVVLSYTSWEEPFDLGFAKMVHAYNATPLVQMDPYGVGMSAIASGAYDNYLRSYADSVKKYGGPIIVGFAHEMNGYWYSWGLGHASARNWIAAWRHVVLLFRSQGADNVKWLWTVNRVGGNVGAVRTWWPGAEYVSLVGIDGYYYHSTDTFDEIFGSTISAVRRLTNKHILLAEIGIGQRAGQAAKIPELVPGIIRCGLLGFVWYDVDSRPATMWHQDWRLEGHGAALRALRRSLDSLG